MACNNERVFQFKDAAGEARYKVTVSGPKGAFTAIADFLDVDTPPQEHWTPELILHPAEKVRPLEGGNAYVATIVVQCVTTKPDPVKVEASVDGEQYCREIACAQGTFERVIHFIKRT
jgi:hypothetical protein